MYKDEYKVIYDWKNERWIYLEVDEDKFLTEFMVNFEYYLENKT